MAGHSKHHHTTHAHRGPEPDHAAHPHHADNRHQPHHVRALYEQGRQYAYGKSPPEPVSRHTETFQPEHVHTRQGLIGQDVFDHGHPAHQKPQAPDDRHDLHYDNDASGWVRGADATARPGFDHSPPRDRMRR